ncbi:hypothetical protein IT415_04115 [bacterium]|nr:hypothetical protein [bacterium]
MPQVQAYLDPMLFPDGLIPDDFKQRVNSVFQRIAAELLSCQNQPDMLPEWFMIVWHELRVGDAFTRPLSFMMHVQHYPDRNLVEAAYQLRHNVHKLVKAYLMVRVLDDVDGQRAYYTDQVARLSVEVEIVAAQLEYSISLPLAL